MVLKTATTPQEPLISFIQEAEAVPALTAVADDLNARQQSNQLSSIDSTPETGLDKNLTLKNDEKSAEAVAEVAEVKQVAMVEKDVKPKLTSEKSAKAKVAKQKSSKKVEKPVSNDMPAEFSAPAVQTETVKTAAKSSDLSMKSTVETSEPQEKSGWNSFKESIKQGHKAACTQVQVSMNQCQQ